MSLQKAARLQPRYTTGRQRERLPSASGKRTESLISALGTVQIFCKLQHHAAHHRHAGSRGLNCIAVQIRHQLCLQLRKEAHNIHRLVVVGPRHTVGCAAMQSRVRGKTRKRCTITILTCIIKWFMIFLCVKRAKKRLYFLHALQRRAARNSLFTGAATAGRIMSRWRRVCAEAFP